MLKEIIAADTGLIFRRSALERAHIDLDELVEAAECTKIEDAKRKFKATTQEVATLVKRADGSSANAMLRVSTVDGGEAVPVRDADDGKTAAEALKEEGHLSLYDRWKSSSVKDALCKMTDELVKAPAWWVLEFLPFIDSNQDEHGRWKNSLR
jgi:hypothetical protein